MATIRPPVAANGWPAASDEPLTFNFDRSIEPSGADSPSRSEQNAGSSQASSVASLFYGFVIVLAVIFMPRGLLDLAEGIRKGGLRYFGANMRRFRL